MSTLVYLATVLLVALAVVFVIQFLEKIGMRDKWIDATIGFKLLHQMLQCDFCFCFWLSFIVGLILFFTSRQSEYLVISVFSTPLARYFLN